LENNQVNFCEQPKICEKIFEGINEKFKVSNHRISDLEQRTEEIHSINNVLIELQLLTKLQREDGIKRDKLVSDISENQTKISNSLDILSSRINNTEISVEKLNKKLDEIKSDNSMKISDIIKTIIILAASMGFGSVLTLILK